MAATSVAVMGAAENEDGGEEGEGERLGSAGCDLAAGADGSGGTAHGRSASVARAPASSAEASCPSPNETTKTLRCWQCGQLTITIQWAVRRARINTLSGA